MDSSTKGINMKMTTIKAKLSELSAAGLKKYSYAYNAGLFESMLAEALIKLPAEKQEEYIECFINPILTSLDNATTENAAV